MSSELSEDSSTKMVSDEDSSSWESLDDEEQEDNICNKISSNTLVLEKVFEHLSVKELLQCRLVSRLWNNTALLQNNLGTKTLIRVRPDNIQRLNQTTENTRSPFCRQFILHMLDLDGVTFLPWIKVFKNCITYLWLDCCTASSSKAVARLLKHQSSNLRELKITGGRLPELAGNPFRRHPFSRLSTLELCSSEDYGQMSKEFMEILVRNSTTALQSIIIGNGSTLWKDFIHLAPHVNLKINQLSLYNLTVHLDITDFAFLQRLRIRSISFNNCIVWGTVLQSVLEMNGNHLRNLCIRGAQHEILSNSFSGLLLGQLTQLTLPIDGVSTEDGDCIIQAFPNLQEFNVIGLLQTKFHLSQSILMGMNVNGFSPCRPSHCQYENTLELNLAPEKRRELLKLLLLLPQQPRKLRINLFELNSSCLRKIYQVFPDLQELTVVNNTRNSLDGWTGIPIKTCRKLSLCKSFGVANVSLVQKLCSVSSLKKLKRLEISIFGDPPKTEFTLLYILYGICQLKQLEELSLSNFTMSDVAFVAISKALRLKCFYINGSLELWNQFKTSVQNNKVKTFLLPPRLEVCLLPDALKTSKVLNKIFTFLPRRDVYHMRLVSRFWHTSTTGFLHSKCDTETRTLLDMDKYLEESKSKYQSGPNKTPREILVESQSGAYLKALEFLRRTPTLINLVIRGMNKSMLEYYQRENTHERFKFKSCEDRRKIIYWFFPNGSDELLVPNPGQNPEPTSIVLIGSWGKKDTGLLEFLDTSSTIASVILHGLIHDVYDLILPRLGAMRNLESLVLLPFSSASVTEISMRHLQILSNASFALKHLVMQKLQAPSSEIADLVRSCRYTLESLEIQNNVNVSDRLSFTIPNLRVLQLDEPPGVGLWTTLNINQNVETVHFERSGYIYNQIKSKAMPKLELVDQENFEHSATNMLCDVNLFLECVSNKRPAGAQKSILQEGADSAMKFFTHFRFLTSLTLRSVHAHYGVLQGIFRNFVHLEKLVFKNTTGITDEILTGIPKYLLDRMDLNNPLNFKKVQNELHEFSNPSIRNLKNLTHLALDDQVTCTDLSIIFGIIRVKRLEYFSCAKWKITDCGVRAITDMTSIKHLITEDCPGVSSYGLQYFKSKTLHRVGS